MKSNSRTARVDTPKFREPTTLVIALLVVIGAGYGLLFVHGLEVDVRLVLAGFAGMVISHFFSIPAHTPGGGPARVAIWIVALYATTARGHAGASRRIVERAGRRVVGISSATALRRRRRVRQMTRP